MTKFVYLLWAPAAIARDRGAIRDLLIDRCAPRLLALGPAKLVAHLDDRESAMRPPSPFRPKGPPPIHGTVDLWLEDANDPRARAPFERVLREAGFEIAGYEVDESVYRDYGDNRHAAPRSWPDGVRSPGVGVITLLERPKRLDHDEWMRRWHGVMSPVSEAIQPRTRYVRNRVVSAVTDGAPAIDGIVVEMWPSVRHVTNPFLFYGARTPIGVAINMARIVRAVRAFHDLTRVRCTTCGEYVLKTSGVRA